MRMEGTMSRLGLTVLCVLLLLALSASPACVFVGGPWDSPDTESQPWDDDWNRDPVDIECVESGVLINGKQVWQKGSMTGVFPQECNWGFDVANEEWGYSACCDQECCSWETPLDGSGLLGEDCWDSDDCTWGLSCMDDSSGPGVCVAPPSHDNCFSSSDCYSGETCWQDGDLGGKCAFGSIGDPCDASHLCSPALYCSVSSGASCVPMAEYEGESCDDGGTPQCPTGMQCICNNTIGCACFDGSEGDPCNSDFTCKKLMNCVMGETGARCYDGTKGDPCEEGTCFGESGLYCAADKDGDLQHCYSGDALDPCGFDLHCHEGLKCIDASGYKHCAELLGDGVPCSDADPGAVCGAGLVCNTGLDMPACTAPGQQGDACAEEEDCVEALFCVEEYKKCMDGHLGSLCALDGDCLPGALCIPSGAAKYCAGPLDIGDVCDPASPYTWCTPPLVCNTALVPPACADASVQGQVCAADDQCVPGLFCAPGLKVCQDGKDGDLCQLPSDCAPGWTCVASKGKCFDGDTADSCDSDAECFPGYACDPLHKQCFAAGHGVPCADTSDCEPGLTCTVVGFQYVCFEFLAEGKECGALAFPFTACEPGHFCDDNLEPPACS